MNVFNKYYGVKWECWLTCCLCTVYQFLRRRRRRRRKSQLEFLGGEESLFDWCTSTKCASSCLLAESWRDYGGSGVTLWGSSRGSTSRRHSWPDCCRPTATARSSPTIARTGRRTPRCSRRRWTWGSARAAGRTGTCAKAKQAVTNPRCWDVKRAPCCITHCVRSSPSGGCLNRTLPTWWKNEKNRQAKGND